MNWLKRHYPDIVRILRLAKYEIEGQMAHVAGKLSPRQHAAAQAGSAARPEAQHLATECLNREGGRDL